MPAVPIAATPITHSNRANHFIASWRDISPWSQQALSDICATGRMAGVTIGVWMSRTRELPIVTSPSSRVSLPAHHLSHPRLNRASTDSTHRPNTGSTTWLGYTRV